jgi:hypothetical protein
LFFQSLFHLYLRVEIYILGSEFGDDIIHDFFVLLNIVVVVDLSKSLLNLLFKFLSESVRWIHQEVVKSSGHSTLVGKISGNLSFVLSNGSTNKGGIEKKPVLWCFALLFQSSE